MFHAQLTVRKQIPCGLIKQETQRAEIHQACRVMRKVEKLDITAIVNTELQSLRHVVYHGGDDGKRLVEIKLRQHLKQGRSFLEFLCCASVDAINLKHYYMLVLVCFIQ